MTEAADNEAQSDLDLHNAAYDAWERMTERERDARIKEAMQ